MELKLNDVYKFYYNDEWSKKKTDPYWCFDGQLIVKPDSNGRLYLKDTYWGGSCEDKVFTLKQALERGELTFICNLDEIEPCEKYNLNYYDDEDIFDLSSQHHCYEKYYIKKGAKKSAAKLERIINEKIKNSEYEIEWNEREIKNLNESLSKVKSGNLNVYI